MVVLVTGATGFVGRALVRRLLGEGHDIEVVSRDPASVPSQLGPQVHAISWDEDFELEAALLRADAVVNLVGAGVMDQRWTPARKRALRSSRVDLTRRIVEGMNRSGRLSQRLIQASATGAYPSGEGICTETTKTSSDFLGQLCQDWEDAAAELRFGRLTILRIGLVVGPEAGLVGELRPLFEAGLGGRLGDGRQWMSWIHVDDLVELIVEALYDRRLSGVFNAVSPQPVRNEEFAHTLARVLGRRAPLPCPAWMLRAVLGERAEVVLQSTRVRPERLQDLGFAFRYATLEEALRSATSSPSPICFAPNEQHVQDLDAAPDFELAQDLIVDAPLEEVLPFFERAENLGLLTPGWTGFRIHGPPPITREGVEIDYTITLGPVPMRWRSEITAWEQGRRFVDVQRRGPYRHWWHEHRFVDMGSQTLIQDRVRYSLPLGPLGRLVHPFVRAALRRIFAYRAHAALQRFGASTPRNQEAA